MSHCPQCGETTPEGARACPFCGSALAIAARPPPTASRTIVGVAARDIAAPVAAAARPAGASKGNRTIVGMPASAINPAAAAAPAARSATPNPGALRTPGPPAGVGRTIVGMATGVLGTPAAAGGEAAAPALPAGSRPAGAPGAVSGTLLGVARPGIAPLAPGVPRAPEPAEDVVPDDAPPPGYEPAGELGATMGPNQLPAILPAAAAAFDKERRKHHHRRAMAVLPGAKIGARDGRERTSNRALAVVFAAGGLALAAVLVAIFWPSPPPLTARARADAGGREGVELTCKSCPDGTKVTIGGSSATMTGSLALVPLASALLVGENRLKVAIDRPANGRDETVGVSINVAYRIRPDLATLQADKPSFQIVAEVAGGTSVTIDGRKMALAGGRAVENIDVTEAVSGLADDVKTLSRQIPYVVTPDSGPPEQGVVNVSVGIVPLHLDAPVALAAPPGGQAPAPHVTTDGPSFVLAGKTMKGAEVLAAGRPITVHADGNFAQVMNVSAVGATQIEVRARMAGMAPRLSQIRVRRVDSLEKAGREFAATESPIAWAALAANVPGAVGRAAALSGEVSEIKKQGYQTVMLLDVSAASGCPSGGGCTVRLVHAAETPVKRGDTLRVFGHVARPFSMPGRADIPEIEVDFTLKGEGAGARERK
jgi:hypothetical protein